MRSALSPIAVLFAFAPSVWAEDWVPLCEKLVKAEKTGYGGVSAVVVERPTSDVLILVSDRGLYRSKDMGQTWKQVGKQFKGRTDLPGSVMFDPRGSGKLVIAMTYGPPILVSHDRGETATFLGSKSNHVDCAGVDWTDNEFFLTLKHESGGLLLASRDGGKSFDEVGKDFATSWVFDAKTAVVSRPKSKENPVGKILRTTDQARTFEPVADYDAKAAPQWFDGALYWLVDGALLKSSDHGKSWQKRGDVKDGQAGPIFGKTSNHLFVTTKKGILESKDGGATWGAPILPPPELKGINQITSLDYDSNRDTLYISKKGVDLFRLTRMK